MKMIRLKYIGGKSVSKLFFNRVRYVFNKENNFTTDVPLGAWVFVKDTNEFIPAPIEESNTEITEPIEPTEPIDETICDVCGFKAKSKTGKIAHRRIKHKEAK